MGQCSTSSRGNSTNTKASKRNVVSSFTKDFYATPVTQRKIENHNNSNNDAPISSFAMNFYDQNNVTNPSISHDIINQTIAEETTEIQNNVIGTNNTNMIMSNGSNEHSLQQQQQQTARHNFTKSLFKLSPKMTSYTYRNLHTNVKDQLKTYSSGVVGMKNLGNTCFMNSSLQCLSNTIPLADYFLGYDFKVEINEANFLGTGGKLATTYADLMKDVWLGKQEAESSKKKKKRHNKSNLRTISPRNFKLILERFAPQFRGYDQQDAHELLAYLLDGIHEDLNRVTSKTYVEDKDCDGNNDCDDSIQSWKNYLLRNRSIIVDLFQGQLRNTLQCMTCNHKSVKFEPFMYLSLPIVSGDDSGKTKNATSTAARTLDECLEFYCRTEILQGDNVWYCPKCKTHVSASKKLDLWMLPPILIIHLKRFKVDSKNRRTKLNNRIEYPIKKLDLSHMLQSSNYEKPIFDLYAISNHVGDLTGGHYTAQALNRVDNKWYDYNDSHCSSLTDVAVLDSSSSSSAYCLFYNRITSTNRNAHREQHTDSISPSVPMIRRQTIKRPELWPHMQNYDDGQFRSFRRM